MSMPYLCFSLDKQSMGGFLLGIPLKRSRHQPKSPEAGQDLSSMTHVTEADFLNLACLATLHFRQSEDYNFQACCFLTMENK